MLTRTMTYGALKQAMACALRALNRPSERLGPTQRLKNLNAGLNSWQLFHQKTDEDEIGTELLERYLDTLPEFLAWLRGQGLSRQTVADRKAIVKKWRTLAIEQCIASPEQQAFDLANPVSHAFTRELQRLVRASGKTVAQLTRELAFPSRVLDHWLRGGQPAPSYRAGVARLEAYFKLLPGSLASLAVWYGRDSRIKVLAPVVQVEYRKNHGRRVGDAYCLKGEQLTAGLRAEWARFVRFKTIDVPVGYERSERGCWRKRPATSMRACFRSWYCQVSQGIVAPSAHHAWQFTAAYLGFLARPVKNHGFGLSPDTLSLAWFADSEKLRGFFEWYVDRAGGIVHGGVFALAAYASSLVNPRFGYLTQHSDFRRHLAGIESPDAWQEACAMSYALCLSYKRAYKAGGEKKSREPDVMPQLLASPHPLHYFLSMISRMQIDMRRQVPGSFQQARHIRDILLVSMLVSNPLRINHFAAMTWRPDNTGNLYQNDAGEWHLRFKPEDFKNERGAARNKKYDASLPVELTAMIRDYLLTYRPRIEKIPSDFVFISNHAASQGDLWHDIDDVIVRLTRGYIEGCPGLAPHYFRHAVATDWLKNNPRDYLTVATLLHDTLATVIRTYGHLEVNDGMRQYNGYLGPMLKEVGLRGPRRAPGSKRRPPLVTAATEDDIEVTRGAADNLAPANE